MVKNASGVMEQLKLGEDCIQSEARGFYNRKWHESCTPRARYMRFGNDMNKPYTKETLRKENETESVITKISQ